LCRAASLFRPSSTGAEASAGGEDGDVGMCATACAGGDLRERQGGRYALLLSARRSAIAPAAIA
jgi:hypothetical protein